ncbi:hypothetical protein JZ751_016750 [Albula glossodonta]|uniref:PDZ domain-containing protein n=1 Tax=Albula glossodonta TaxID=121402 RepID=A0A8T2NXT9_9TELE|nr:hypothetical protein JZ751_016750 [Albula glossodonta]
MKHEDLMTAGQRDRVKQRAPCRSGVAAERLVISQTEACGATASQAASKDYIITVDDVTLPEQVGPDSIAARDGRIREGDRILQINGQDIQNKEEAVTVLSNEDCINILLLVARPEIQLDEGWLDDEQNDFLEELKMEMLEEQRKDEIKHSAVQQVGTMVEPRERDEVDEEIRADVATCSSNVQDEASTEGDTPSRVQSRSTHGLQDRNRVPGEQLDSDCTTPQADEEDEEDEEECERFQQLLELKCQIRNSGEYDLYYSRRSTIECSLGEPEGMQRELRLLNEELRSIELECQNIMQAHQLRLTQNQSPGGSPMVNKPAHICELPEKSDKDRDKDKDSSSAYNTAESCRSTPLAMRRSSDNSLQRTVSTANLKNLRATAAAQSRQAKPGILEQKEASPSPSPSPSLSPSPYLSPYRHANIPAHARHYQSYMHLIQQRSAVEYGQSQLSLLSMCKDPQRPGESSRTEWKVKVRSDGTRYITKRPVRDRLLRERALKIREERGGGGGTTTDDDAASELKMGRYWSKEERKQHLLRAREQRRRREFMMRSRLESLRENPQSGGEGGRKEVSILELSHRKMMKKRNRKILDNWMTIQELMTHGARTPEDTSVHNAFLSVTTV